MRILIDTHTFLWFFSSSPRLTSLARNLIERNSSTTLISIASIWEISIKNSKGKLNIAGGFERIPEILNYNDIDILPIDLQHTLEHNQLSFHHHDPFDRMIAAQAIAEGIDLVSIDDVFDEYFTGTEVKQIW